jgi:hypothetical protein
MDNYEYGNKSDSSAGRQCGHCVCGTKFCEVRLSNRNKKSHWQLRFCLWEYFARKKRRIFAGSLSGLFAATSVYKPHKERIMRCLIKETLWFQALL